MSGIIASAIVSLVFDAFLRGLLRLADPVVRSLSESAILNLLD
jgi:hypothetical protein